MLLVGVLPASAQAKESHIFKEDFGSVGQPSFQAPEALAVDQGNSDLLVVDRLTGTLSRFKPDGEPDPFSALATNVIDGKEGGPDETPQKGLNLIDPRVEQIAIDESSGPGKGNIYLAVYPDKLIDVFAPTGAYLGQLTEFKQGPAAEGSLKPMGAVCGVAVDSTGAVYVGDNGEGEVHEFAPAGNPVSNADSKANFAVPHVCMLGAGAGPTADSLFAAELNVLGGSGHVLKRNAATGVQEYPVSTDANLEVAVDPGSGHVYAATGNTVKDFDASGASEATLLDAFSGSDVVNGVAVDATTGDVYVARNGLHEIEVWETIILPEATTEAATAVTAEAATLHGTLNAEGPLSASCRFDYTTKAAYDADKALGPPHDGFAGASTAPCSPSGPFTGTAEHTLSATLTGLDPGTAYRFRLVATNDKGSTPQSPEDGSHALGFQTEGPTVSVEAVSDITTSSATLSAAIDPNGLATSFQAEYVSEADFQASGYADATTTPVPAEDIGSGTEPVTVEAPISGLDPAGAYHFRFSATDADEVTSHGPGQSFSAYPTPSQGLPDSRAWELVSPPLKLGEVFAPDPKNFLGGSCTECLPGSNDLTMPMQARPDGGAVAYEGQAFASGLAPGANEYLAGRSAAGWSSEGLSGLSFASGRDGFSGFKAFSTDLGKAVLAQSTPALSPQAPTAPDGTAYSNLYLRSEGELTPLVTVEPPNRTAGTGSGAFRPVFSGANSGSAQSPAFSHLVFEADDALTEEVSGIAPAAPTVGPSQCKATTAECDLYEWVGGELRLIDVLPGNAVAVPGVIGAGRMLSENPDFEAPDVDHAISADGRKVFWSDAGGQLYVRIDGSETLKVEDPGTFLVASADGSRVLLSDGCLYSLETEECESELGTPATFQGILGSSEDLSRVYFVDKADLGGENARHESPTAGKPNLYSHSGASTAFIATLDKDDNATGGIGNSLGDWKATPQNRTAQVSPDGEFLAFMSKAPLTGYDNEPAGGQECRKNRGFACEETFEYSSATEELTCASCNPTGSNPLGQSNLSLISVNNAAPPFPQPHNLTDSGRLFFESQDKLSANDQNGHIQDVYEWEPQGVGSCEKKGGCVYLISSGQSPNDSMFLDATPNGDDAFFVTRSELVKGDTDDQLDLYDARVGGGIEENEAPPCAGEACKGAPSVPAEFPTPGSETFSGTTPSVTPKPCKKGQVRRHGRCVAKHRRHAKHNKRG